MIPASAQSALTLIEIVNANQLHLDLTKPGEVPDPLWLIVKSIFFQSLLTSLAYAMSFYWLAIKKEEQLKKIQDMKEETDKRIQEIKEEKEKRTQELQKAQSQLLRSQSEHTSTIGRVRIVLLAKISDYARELDFWRIR